MELVSLLPQTAATHFSTTTQRQSVSSNTRSSKVCQKVQPRFSSTAFACWFSARLCQPLLFKSKQAQRRLSSSCRGTLTLTLNDNAANSKVQSKAKKKSSHRSHGRCRSATRVFILLLLSEIKGAAAPQSSDSVQRKKEQTRQ